MDLINLFQHNITRESYCEFINEIFNPDKPLKPTEFDPVEALSDSDNGYCTGIKCTSDHYVIGFFYYEIGRSDVTRKKVGLHKLVHKFINTSHINYRQFDAVLVAFRDSDHWRLSFICDIEDESTAPKRFTFVFGDADNLYKTPLDRFGKLQQKGISKKNIQDAFSVEALNDQFFEDYKAHYEKFCNFLYEHADDPNFFGEEFALWNRDTNTKKYLRDYVKNLLGRIVFLHFLQKKGWMGVPDDSSEWKGGRQNFMYELFRNSTQTQKENFLDDVLKDLFFNCLNTDRSADNDVYDTKVISIGKVRIPYLNGELFEKEFLDKKKSKFSVDLFENLFNLFNSYNFTIDENDPSDAEIGVDPEMLGKIFENLLEDNKDKGAFYTPKEIVSYMCKESLIAYLQSKIGKAHHDSIRTLVNTHLKDQHLEDNPNVCERLNKALRDVKVCDPAIGSGAFPMGLLNEIFACRCQLEISDKPKDELKGDIIQNNIYGVDIERGAVDIARLRFWLALVVDAEKPVPLPNLDFKIMQGNSLLESYKGLDLSNLMQNDDMFVQMKAEEVEKDIKAYFKAKTYKEKRELRERINFDIIQCLNFAGFQDEIEIPNSDFFLWHTYFRDVFSAKDEEYRGFDIVIGNPPFIQLQSMLKMSAVYKDAKFETYDKTGDIYCLFVEQGFKLLKKNGTLTYIIPNKWMQAAYGRQLREYLAKKRILNIVDFGDVQLFENATTYTCIPLLQQAKPYETFTASYMKSADISTIPNYSSTFDTKDFGKEAWVLSSSRELKLINKLKKKYPTLKVYSKGEAYRGVLSGLSAAFLVGTDVYNDLVNKNANEQKIVPFLLGRDIKPYASPTPNKYMILFEKGFTRQQYGESLSEEAAWEYIKEEYPSIADWLVPFTEKGRKRGDKGDYWWELRACDYYNEFAKPKIMYQAFQVKPNFIYDETGCYCNNSMWILPTDNKALLGLLNSKMGWWLISMFCSQIQNGYQLIWKYFGQIPIALEENKQQSIIALVDRILSAKKANPLADTTAEEREIDRLVYELYGLTNDEVKIIDRNETTVGSEDDLFKA